MESINNGFGDLDVSSWSRDKALESSNWGDFGIPAANLWFIVPQKPEQPAFLSLVGFCQYMYVTHEQRAQPLVFGNRAVLPIFLDMFSKMSRPYCYEWFLRCSYPWWMWWFCYNRSSFVVLASCLEVMWVVFSSQNLNVHPLEVKTYRCSLSGHCDGLVSTTTDASGRKSPMSYVSGSYLFINPSQFASSAWYWWCISKSIQAIKWNPDVVSIYPQTPNILQQWHTNRSRSGCKEMAAWCALGFLFRSKEWREVHQPIDPV